MAKFGLLLIPLVTVLVLLATHPAFFIRLKDLLLKATGLLIAASLWVVILSPLYFLIK